MTQGTTRFCWHVRFTWCANDPPSHAKPAAVRNRLASEQRKELNFLLIQLTYSPPMTDAQPNQDRADPTDRHHHHAYYQLIHTLCAYLPPPLDDTPEALLIRNQAAVAKVAAMASVDFDTEHGVLRFPHSTTSLMTCGLVHADR